MKSLIFFVAGFAAGAIAAILYLTWKDEREGAERLELIEIDPFTGQPIPTDTGETKMSEIREGKKRRIKLIPKTRGGNVAGIEPGSVRFTSTDESVVSVVQDPNNELEADVIGVDGSNNESAMVEGRADGIRGEGVRELIATRSYTCTQGDAFVFDFEEGEETDVEEPEPVTGTGGVGSGAGNEANQGVENNPSAGAGAGSNAAGTTAPDESNQRPNEDAGAPMTFDEAAKDTADRNSDTALTDPNAVPGAVDESKSNES